MSSHEILDEAPAERRRVSRPVLIGVIVIAVIGIAAIVGWLAFGGDSGSGSASATAGGTTLAVVTRRDLAETQTESGTLGYADSRALSYQSSGSGQSQGQGAATSSGSSTVTWLAPEGSVVRRGGVLYRVDNAPTLLLYGTVPAYRALAAGVADGPDVRQLEQNLAALGYDPGTVDAHFDSATTAAVERWQDALGQTQTGSVALGSVAFLPGPRRIGEQTATVGSTVGSGSPVLTTTSTAQQVTVELDATDQTLAVVGRRVGVDLPDGSTVPGRIISVGNVAQSSSSSSSTSDAGSGSSTPSATIEVDIALLKPAPGALDQAPVDVDLTTQSASHVLAVPVTALVALLGGGYAVEVSTGGTTRLVAVTPGLYAGGYVELTRGVREGERVVVPQ